MTHVFKVSKEGYDVRAATDKQLAYSSELASHSIFNTISASIPAGGTGVTFSHGLDFVPKVWIFMVDSDVDGTFYRRIPYLDETDFQVDYYINSSDVVIEADGNQTSRLDFKVIVFTRSPQP